MSFGFLQRDIFCVFLLVFSPFLHEATADDSDAKVDEMVKAAEAAAEELRRSGPLSDARVEEARSKLGNLKYPCSLDTVCEVIGIPRVYLIGRVYYAERKDFFWVRFPLTDSYSMLLKAKTMDFADILETRIERIASLKDLSDFSSVETK